MNRIVNKAQFDGTGSAVIISELEINQADVVGEARHWVTGERGQRCDDLGELADADLTTFATEALVLGAKALALTAQSTETRALERMIKDVGDKTAEATRQAGEVHRRGDQVRHGDSCEGSGRRQEGNH